MSYVPLHTHSEYSILNSTLSIDALVERAKAQGLSALALTDESNLFGAVEFFNACTKAKIKPILGCELKVAPGSRLEKKRVGLKGPSGFSLIFLVKNQQGYKNLCKLSSKAYIEGFYYTPRIDRELLNEHKEGLICITGDPSSYLSFCITEGHLEEAEKELKELKALFGEDLFIEVQRHHMSEEALSAEGFHKESFLIQGYQDLIQKMEKVEKEAIRLGSALEIPIVATVDVHYLDREDWKAHEILKNIQSGEPCEIWEKDSFGNLKDKIPNPKRDVYFSHEHDFKSYETLKERFKDHPEWLENTKLVADRCQLQFDFKTKHYPVYTPPAFRNRTITEEERAEAAAQYLKTLCHEGIPKRYTPDRLDKLKELFPEEEPLSMIHKRLEYELNLIVSKGMGDYLLIVWDFIHWAKSQGIPMGPGRGSGAGSIILFLIGITDIEPLRFNLFFERFINPERLSYPDIDVDICMDRRPEVIQYTIDTYGKEKVAQIITFGTMKAKMAIKDVGRVLSIPLTKVNQIAKLIPDDLTITIDKALEVDPELKQLYETEEETKRWIDIAIKLEGSVRNTGIHAAGLIISAHPLMELIPVCASKDSDMLVTQYSMKPVEAVGMLKIDFLGLKTLTSIQEAVRLVQESSSVKIDWVNLPLDDAKTFDLLNQGKTMGVFQLESSGMQDLAKQLHIDKFEEIIAVGALYRPGPMEMIPSFIQRKHGLEPIEIDHPYMKDILSETYGIMVYQEQVMQIASRLAGYSLGEGDVLRRAMGKKDKDEMARQREKFKAGALKNQIDETVSMKIFDKVEKFASYGFNKSHAAAYGYLSYVTAYLKANYPSQWLAALMTCDRDDLSKVTKVIRESQAMGIAVLGPDVNDSGLRFSATTEGIRFALSAIKGVGEGVISVLIEERQKRGPFKDFFDFIDRIEVKKIGKKTIEHFIDAGAFDRFGIDRDCLLENLEEVLAQTIKKQDEKAKGILNLFDSLETVENSAPKLKPALKTRSRFDRLKREYELLGFYLNGHPLDDYKDQIAQVKAVSLADLSSQKVPSVIKMAGILESVSVKISNKSQKKFAIVSLSDGEDRLELPIWSDVYEASSSLIVDNQLVLMVVSMDQDQGQVRYQVKGVADLIKLDEAALKEVDELVSKAQSYLRYQQKQEKGGAMKKQEAELKPKKKWTLDFQADSLSLSHILKLKSVFRDYPGDNPLVLSFHSGKKKLGEVVIDSTWGVSHDLEWVEKIKNCPGLARIEFVEIS